MNVNKFKITMPQGDGSVNVGIGNSWEPVGLNDGYPRYEEESVAKVVNPPIDLEVDRYSHENYHSLNGAAHSIHYEFMFDSVGTYINSYITPDLFNGTECFYNVNSFKNSFFKLDLYDSPSITNRKKYLTIILPTWQGRTEQVLYGTNNVDIKKPYMELDFLGDTEGFFIYWLKKKDYLDIDEFHMTAKFFDAKNGGFIRMLNAPPPSPAFDDEQYLYYRVVLDPAKKTYKVFNTWTGMRAGTGTNPMKWFEYIGI